jgi:hypothetical protein
MKSDPLPCDTKLGKKIEVISVGLRLIDYPKIGS